MSSPINPMAGSVILIAVFDGIAISEGFESTSCSFVLVEGVSIGYRYSSEEDFTRCLDRAYDLLFEETLRRFRAKKHPI